MDPVQLGTNRLPGPDTSPDSEWSTTSLTFLAATFGVVPWMFATSTPSLREMQQARQ